MSAKFIANTKKNSKEDMSPLDRWADLPIWVAWEERSRNGSKTKVPLNPNGKLASSADPGTWGEKAAAEMRSGRSGRVGIILGNHGDFALGGIDLDSCLDPGTGRLTPWAREVVRRFDSYAEVSPSGEGVKLFFLYDPADLAALDMKHGKSFSRGDHCEIALHVSNRYFTVTGETIDEAPAQVKPVPGDALQWLIGDAGPRFASGKGKTGSKDESGSGELFRLACDMKNQGGSEQERWATFEAAIADHPAAADHVRRSGKRAIERAWERAPDIADEFEDLPPREHDPERERTGLTFLSPADCAVRVEREYVVKGMIARSDVGCIVGAPGVGKSFVGPHLGYMVAQGRHTFGMRTRPGKVFYVAAEDEHGMRNRVRALHDRHGDAADFTLIGGVSDLLSKGSRDRRDLRAAVERERPALIFLDTLAMAFPGLEENTAEGMGRVVAVVRSLTKWGAAVVLIHHDTKDGLQGLPRGHSLLNGALDMSIHLTRGDDEITRGKLTKNRNGPCDRDLAFRIESVELEIDSDGDPVTAGLCNELDAVHAPPAGQKLTPSAEAALNMLARLLSKQDRVTETDWREACVSDRKVSAAESRDSRSKAFRRAVTELARAEKVIPEGHFWRLPNTFDEFAGENDETV